MKRILETLLDELKAGKNVVLVTVVASSGSTPRGEGARMVVGSGGRLYGTIGGGAVEYESEKMAMDLLEQGRSAFHYFRLKPNQVQDLGMVCGGNVNVFFQHMQHTDAEFIALLEHALQSISGLETKWLVTRAEGCDWTMSVADQNDGMLPERLLKNDAVQMMDGEVLYFAEPLMTSGIVYIFGGGHVAQQLQPVLTHVDFRCVIFEDRPEFCTHELFPTAEQLILGDFQNIAEKVSLTEHDYVVVMTRGHACDYEIERQVLATPACYIGVIGSRGKVAVVSKKLMADGYSQHDLDRIYTPIGLDIKAETPAEIAISIAAEMIQIRAELISRK